MPAILPITYRALERLSLWLAYAALLAMMVLTTLDAFMRYGMSQPILGVDGLIEEVFMPMIVYLAATHVYATGGHIRVTVFSAQLPDVVRHWLFVAFDMMAFVLMLLIADGVGRRAIQSYVANEYSTNPLGYLLAPSFAIVAFGSGLLALRILMSVFMGRSPDSVETIDHS